MNLSQMQTLVYRYGFTTDDPVTSVLNSSLHEIETMSDWSFLEEGPYNFQLAGGANSLVLPSDFRKIISLKDTDHLVKLLPYRRNKFAREIRDETEQGNPVIYTIINTNQIQVWQVPLLPVNLQLVYQGSTPDMVNPSDVPTTGTQAWPLYMHMPIVFRTASVLLQMENEEDRAKTAQDEFRTAIMSAMAADGERDLDEVETVEDEQGYGSNTSRALHGF